MFSITLSNTETHTVVAYTSDERASLDHVGIVCEYLCNMVLPDMEGEDDADA